MQAGADGEEPSVPGVRMALWAWERSAMVEALRGPDVIAGEVEPFDGLEPA